MIQAQFQAYNLKFKQSVGTSRGVLTSKKTYFLHLKEAGLKGIGECALFEGLSAEEGAEYESQLQWLCDSIHLPFEELYEKLRPFPSIQIGLEQALLNLQHSKDLYFPSSFYNEEEGIPINGLIWMGAIPFMEAQFKEKIKEGYRCIKFKIGVNWNQELPMLKKIRLHYAPHELEIRVDANGAFRFPEVFQVLEELSLLSIHSIEQPIASGEIEKMQKIIAESPVPIALDEELIGKFYFEDKKNLLESVQPAYLILKPSLIGGFKGTLEWISLAKEKSIGWWITSALESNIGLNALAQFTATLSSPMPQGLGTGSLYLNNFPSNLYIKNCKLWHSKLE